MLPILCSNVNSYSESVLCVYIKNYQMNDTLIVVTRRNLCEMSVLMMFMRYKCLIVNTYFIFLETLLLNFIENISDHQIK